MDDVCLQMYGYAYQDGSKQRSKGTVEQLKRGRQNAVSYEIAHKAATDAACAAKIEQTEQDIAARWAQADADYVERMEQLNESYDRRKADDDDYLTERRQKADDEIRAYAKSAKDKIDAEAAKLRRAKLGELESLQQRIEDLERKKDTLQDVVYDLQDDMDLMVMAGWLQSNGDVLAAAQELAAGDMQQDFDRYEQEHGR
jgi:chromosome segregation ATPase